MSDFDDDEPSEARPRATRGGTRRPAAAGRPPSGRDNEPVVDDDLDDEFDDERPAPRKRRATAARSGAPSQDEIVDDDWDDDWDDDERGTGPRRDLTLVLGIVVAVLVIALVVVLTRPKDDNNKVSTGPTDKTEQPAGDGPTTSEPKPVNWQGPVAEGAGQVPARIKKEAGIYLWTDFEGFHVRNTTDQPVDVVVEADTVTDQKTGGDPKNSVSATVAAGDEKKGLDLDLGFSASAKFTISRGGAPVPPGDIKLGGGVGQADQNPIVLSKA